MKVLIIDEEIPYPMYTGKKLRTFNLVKKLAEKHDITYLCYGNRADELPKRRGIRFVTVNSQALPQKGFRFYLSLAKNVFSRHPYIVTRHYSKLMEGTVLSLIRHQAFDLIHCEWTPYTEVLKKAFPCPSVLSTHNVEAQIWRRYFETEKNLPKKAYIYLQYKKLFNYEKSACSRYSQITAVSSEDKALLRNWYGATNITVVPNGVDAEYFRPYPTEPRPNSIVFTGSMDWRPNQDAVRYFLAEIFPKIQKKISSASFTVVGRRPPEWLRKMASTYKRVAVTGTVKDVRPYIAQSSLYVVPLRIGGGSRLKILEALAMAKPVLSTSVGSEGLELQNGKHLVVANSSTEFAQKAAHMLSHPEDSAVLAAEGMRKVLKCYTWDTIARILETVWIKAANRKISRPT